MHMKSVFRKTSTIHQLTQQLSSQEEGLAAGCGEFWSGSNPTT